MNATMTQAKKSNSFVVNLPNKGKAIIASDFHGSVNDFMQLMATTNLVARWQRYEEVFLVITGDVPDTTRHRYFDNRVPVDGDAMIADCLVQLNLQFPGRIIYLEGNHDFHLARIVQEIENFHRDRKLLDPLWINEVLNPAVVQAYFRYYKACIGPALFACNVQPYDMIHRVTRDHLEFLASGSVIAVLPGSGIVVTHAGPVRLLQNQSPKQLAAELRKTDRSELLPFDFEVFSASPVSELQNTRFSEFQYEVHDVVQFCRGFESNILVTGHTPLVCFRNLEYLGCEVTNNMGVIGDRQSVICTSFGAFTDASKVYLEVDLSQPYQKVSDLQVGTEIKNLWPS